MERLSQFSAMATNDRVDGGSGVIYGVSVITKGEAQGRNAGTWIDETTLSQIASTAQKYRDGIKVKLSEYKEHDGSVGQVVGVLRDFRVETNRVRADLHLLKSDDNFQKILEMSTTMPSEFGLSVVIPREIEKVDGKDCLRCSEIYSVDLVESPAANPTGLFSQKTNEPETSMSKIKYAKGEDGDHATECECKECMSKQSRLAFTKYAASMLGLDPEKATEADIKARFSSIPPDDNSEKHDDDDKVDDGTTKKSKASKKLSETDKGANAEGGTDGKMSKFSSELDEVKTQLACFRQAADNAAFSAKKTEIAGLVADATRVGKVIPLTDEQLWTMEIPVIKSMFSKLVPNQVAFSKGRGARPVKADGTAITLSKREEVIEFCRQKQAEGAARLTAEFSQRADLGLTQN